jgi:hypothetical protein
MDRTNSICQVTLAGLLPTFLYNVYLTYISPLETSIRSVPQYLHFAVPAETWPEVVRGAKNLSYHCILNLLLTISRHLLTIFRHLLTIFGQNDLQSLTMPVLPGMHIESDPAVPPHANPPSSSDARASFMHKDVVGIRRRPSRLLSAGLVTTALATLIGGASASAQQTPGDIGASWTDRRPMGQIIFASQEDITQTNMNGWTNGGPINLGVGAFQQNILSQVNAAIQNTLNMHGQGIIIWDITGCGKTTWTKGNEMYLGDPRFLDPHGAGLTVQTSYSPYVPPTSPLGQHGIEPAMNAIADQVFAAIRSAGLVAGICLKGEEVYVDSVGDLNGFISQDRQLDYTTTPNQLADLDAKLSYAYHRWGCRIFYVDSNVAANDVIGAQQNQLNPTFAPAWVYTQLRLRHPDCLICPEETYPGTFSFPSLGINDPAYQYDRVACRYTELRQPWMGPSIKADEAAAVPTAFTMILVSDTDMSADQSIVVPALQNNQCILLGVAAVPGSADVSLITNLQTAAGVNGF